MGAAARPLEYCDVHAWRLAMPAVWCSHRYQEASGEAAGADRPVLRVARYRP